MSLLTDQEIHTLFRANCVDYPGNYEVTPGQSQRIARAIEAAVIEKIKSQGEVAWRFDISEDSYNEKWGFTESKGLAKSGDPRAQPLYSLPEGD